MRLVAPNLSEFLCECVNGVMLHSIRDANK